MVLNLVWVAHVIQEGIVEHLRVEVESTHHKGLGGVRFEIWSDDLGLVLNGIRLYYGRLFLQHALLLLRLLTWFFIDFLHEFENFFLRVSVICLCLF